MASRYAMMSMRMGKRENTDFVPSVDSLALSSLDSRTVGELALASILKLPLIIYSYKLAAIKLMTASQEHLEKHCM